MFKNNKIRTISIVNQKGGVGKTTTTINLATALAAVGLRCLIIDLDPQGNASTGVGVEISKRGNNLYRLLCGVIEIKDALTKTAIPNLDIIVSTPDLSAAEIEFYDLDNKEYIIKSLLSKLNGIYDFVFIDCPPSLGILTVNALVASNSVLIPLQCEFFALEGLTNLLKTIEIIKRKLNIHLEIEGVLLTMYDKRNKVTEQIELDVRKVLGKKVFKTIIPRNIRISEAPSHGVPVIIYDTKCIGSASYLHLAKEILKNYKIKLVA